MRLQVEFILKLILVSVNIQLSIKINTILESAFQSTEDVILYVNYTKSIAVMLISVSELGYNF